MRNLLFTAAALSFGCGDQSKLVGDEEDTGPTGLLCDGMPTVDHDEFDEPQRGDASVTISAVIVGDPTPGCEDVQPLSVELFYKKMGVDGYSSINMDKTAGGNEFTATIASVDIGSSKMFYYFEVFVSQEQQTMDPEGSKDANRNAYDFIVSSI